MSKPPLHVTPPVKTVADLEARSRALELKLDRLQAVEDVENLETTYGYYADKSQQDAISALFADDATLEILGRGIFIGRDRTYEYMRRLGVPTPGTLFNHMQLQPVVHVSADGASANVRARLFVMFGRDGAAQWGEGVYENRFVRDHGVWKYQSLTGYQSFYTDYDKGWTNHSVPMMSYFPGYPPDQPARRRLPALSRAVHAAVPLREPRHRPARAGFAAGVNTRWIAALLVGAAALGACPRGRGRASLARAQEPALRRDARRCSGVPTARSMPSRSAS